MSAPGPSLQPHLKMLDAGASKEAPFVLEADGSSGESEEAQPYVYPPHLDGLRIKARSGTTRSAPSPRPARRRSS